MSTQARFGSAMVSILALFVLFMSTAPLKDAGAIRGYVYDIKGNPVPGVVVIARNSRTGAETKTLTGLNGYFHMAALAYGPYKVRAELTGTDSITLKGELTEERKTLTLTFTFKQTLKDMEEKLADKTLKEGVVGGVTGGVRNQAIYRTRPGEAPFPVSYHQKFNTEEYDRIYEIGFRDSLTNPLSTFSIDVDTASYANIRRFIQNNQFPYEDAVRIEEMINYFSYDYPLPADKHPFAVYTEISACPWNAGHRLVHIGLQGKKLETKDVPQSNLVFLLDVSGSMQPANKLPLLKTAFKLLVNELDSKDRVAIVVYAGAAGLVLPSTPASQKNTILEAIEKLHSGGSTAGGAGIKLAYKVAEENFIAKGNNRVILATDGDFNVGISSTSGLVRMIEDKRDKGVFLTVLGFGMGNYKDGRMEKLADKGNGNYHYIDNLLEAKKVFIDDMRGTLFTIAKDVKLQIEFNPAKVKAYRLIGYENRMLKKEDFDDDTKDAGELGAGHTVTALYEIIPFGSKEEIPGIDDLKYQTTKIDPKAFKSKELLTLKLRYKRPDGTKSKLIESALEDKPIELARTSANFKFSAAVAGFGMLLRDSAFMGNTTYESILKLAQDGRGPDRHGYRAEFIKLVEMSRLLKQVSSN